MSDLDEKEQNHVRAALHYLRFQLHGAKPVAKALGTTPLTVIRITDKYTPVSASMALRVVRLLNVPFDDLLLGRYQPGACPKCGHRRSTCPSMHPASPTNPPSSKIRRVSLLPGSRW